MGAVVQGRIEDFPRVEKKGIKWYFRAFYKPVPESDEYTMAEISLMSRDVTQAVRQLNAFAENVMRIEDRIDESYFDD